MFQKIVKENGKIQDYSAGKAKQAIQHVLDECGETTLKAGVYLKKTEQMLQDRKADEIPTSREWAECFSDVCKQSGHENVGKAYLRKRRDKARARLANSSLMKSFQDIARADGNDPNSVMTENANINGFDPAAQMHRFGSESNKAFVLDHLLPEHLAEAHRTGQIHIHDLDYFILNYNCLQIDLLNALRGGFNTGEAFNREPSSITTACALAAIIIQTTTNQQHGGCSLGNLDFGLAPFVNKSYRKIYRRVVKEYYAISGQTIPSFYESENFYSRLYYGITDEEIAAIAREITGGHTFSRWIGRFSKLAKEQVEEETDQAVQGFIHNVNTLHSRAANQVPFSSVNFGLDVSEAGRLVSRKLMERTEKGLGNGETPIFPISIFHCLTGVNYLPGDPNYDLFQMAIRCSCKRMYPNFNFLDSPFEFQYLRNKQGVLLWKDMENYYVQKNQLDLNEQQSMNLLDRIRKIQQVDLQEHKKRKGAPFDIKAWMVGDDEDGLGLEIAHCLGVQYPSGILLDHKQVRYFKSLDVSRKHALGQALQERKHDQDLQFDLNNGKMVHFQQLGCGFDDRTTVARMGCRTRVVGDVLLPYGCDKNAGEPVGTETDTYRYERGARPPYGTTFGRGNFNFVSMNLPGFAMQAVQKVKHAKMNGANSPQVQNLVEERFVHILLHHMFLAYQVLQIRENLIASKMKKNFQFVLGQNIVAGADQLEDEDSLTADIWDHFSKSVGFIGLSECCTILWGKHLSEIPQVGQQVVQLMSNWLNLVVDGVLVIPDPDPEEDGSWDLDDAVVATITGAAETLLKLGSISVVSPEKEIIPVEWVQ